MDKYITVNITAEGIWEWFIECAHTQSHTNRLYYLEILIHSVSRMVVLFCESTCKIPSQLRPETKESKQACPTILCNSKLFSCSPAVWVCVQEYKEAGFSLCLHWKSHKLTIKACSHRALCPRLRHQQRQRLSSFFSPLLPPSLSFSLLQSLILSVRDLAAL